MVAIRIVQGAARGNRRLPGISVCSGQQYAADALVKPDPRFGFNFPSIAFPGDFPCRGALKSVAQDANLALPGRPHKKVQQIACIDSIRYDQGMQIIVMQ
jgi:hypothetical protein